VPRGRGASLDAMTESLHVRPARPGEAPALTALAMRSKAYWGYDEAFMERVAPAMHVAPDHVEAGWGTVAERDGEVVGFALLRPDLDPPELDSLFIEPGAIGTGAGRALLAAAAAQASAAGIGELLIEADPNAESFYVAQGAVRCGSRATGPTGRDLPLLRLRTGA
jgi:N-acetylglutamate synthase-like GNAT family acetyltransferase